MEQTVLVENPEPDNACYYYGICGNEAEGKERADNEICDTCLSAVRDRDGQDGEFENYDVEGYLQSVYSGM